MSFTHIILALFRLYVVVNSRLVRRYHNSPIAFFHIMEHF